MTAMCTTTSPSPPGPLFWATATRGCAGPQGAVGPGLHEPGLSGGHRSRGKDPAGGPLRRAGPLRRLRRGRSLQRHPGGPGLYRTPLYVKFKGQYNGAWTSFWAAAPTAAISRPGTAWTRTTSTRHVLHRGPRPHALDDCLLAEYNDLRAALFQQQGDQIACVIMEPVTLNMTGCMPEPGFLEGLRSCVPVWRADGL